MSKLTEEIKDILNNDSIKWSLNVSDWISFVEELISEVERFETIFEPMSLEARKALEMNAMPVLLNGGSSGSDRLAQLIVEWHEAEKRTAARYEKITQTLLENQRLKGENVERLTTDISSLQTHHKYKIANGNEFLLFQEFKPDALCFQRMADGVLYFGREFIGYENGEMVVKLIKA